MVKRFWAAGAVMGFLPQWEAQRCLRSTLPNLARPIANKCIPPIQHTTTNTAAWQRADRKLAEENTTSTNVKGRIHTHTYYLYSTMHLHQAVQNIAETICANCRFTALMPSCRRR